MVRNSPIGVFDSGVGGLAVARYLQRCLPQENFVFFGDTAHLPYGDRSAQELLAYTKAISQFLLAHNLKALVVACNTVSTIAGDWLRVNLNIPVIDVINPVARHLSAVYRPGQQVGLVGTKVTVSSGIYEKRIRLNGGYFDFKAWAMPELVPMIECININHTKVQQLLKQYADRLTWSQLDGLILGCTHYPWVYEQFREVLSERTDLWDAGLITAQELRAQLTAGNLLNTDDATKSGNWLFYLSESRANVQDLIARFWGGCQIELVKWYGLSLEPSKR